MSEATQGIRSHCTGRVLRRGIIVCYVGWVAVAGVARGGTRVAVIDEDSASGTGAAWCALLASKGHDCVLYPDTGPTEPLDSFQVLIDLSSTWADPTHLLAEFLQARKGVILWGAAAYTLGVQTDPIVQAYVGATEIAGGSGILVTVGRDPIFGSIPPGTEIDFCGDGPCSALWTPSVLPDAKVLARWEGGTTDVGVLRNTWESGQSVFFTSNFSVFYPLHQQIILRTVGELAHPIPSASAWGVFLMFLGIACSAAIVLRRIRSIQASGLSRWRVAACGVVWLATLVPAQADTKVAVIEHVAGGGVTWCDFLIANGYSCTVFPPSGPTAALDSFQVVIDLSEVWPDTIGSLGDFMQAGKAVITRGGVPGTLGVETDPIVQAWVGASLLTIGGGSLQTTEWDVILGTIPPGTFIGSCGDGPCAGLAGETGFPNAKVLARWVSGDDSVGMMRNSWKAGQSLYLPYGFFIGGPQNQGILLRAMEVLTRPIPTVSTWGVMSGAIFLFILASLILQRNRTGGVNRRSNADRKVVPDLLHVGGIRDSHRFRNLCLPWCGLSRAR